jgi:transcriptional repressor BetI
MMARPLPRKRIEDIRRVELIEAAHRVFMRAGLDGMTSQSICREAGMSPGILSYYFKGKDAVLLAMVRYNNRILMSEIVARLRRASTRWDRLNAIIEGNFPASTYNVNAARAWLSVCAATETKPGFGRLQDIFYRRLHSNLSHELATVLPPPALAQTIIGIGVMIDGLWLRKAAGSHITCGEAVSLIKTYIASQLTAPQRRQLDKSSPALP